MRQAKGSTLAQYGIIILLIAVAVVPAFLLLGETIVDQFTNFYNVLASSQIENNVSENNSNTNNTPDDNSDSGDNTDSTTSGPSQEDPEITCSGDSCQLDFGDYVLAGIPSDFQDYVNAAGSAGGTESLALIFDQLAQKANTNSEQKGLLEELANLGHDLSDMQERIELTAGQIANTGDYAGWARDEYRTIENYTAFQNKLDQVVQSLNTPGNMHDQNLLSIAELLGSEIMTMNDNLVNQCTTVNDIVSALRTGGSSSMNLQQEAYNLMHPSTSEITDIDSAIICNTGNGEDQGEHCH